MRHACVVFTLALATPLCAQAGPLGSPANQGPAPIEVHQPAANTGGGFAGLVTRSPKRTASIHANTASSLGGTFSNAAPMASTGTVLPKAFTNTMGDGSNTYPQGRANMRYQQVFLGSEIGPSQTWTELCLRRDESAGGPAESQHITLIIGDTTLNQSNLGTNFDKNYRNKLSPVFDGTLNLPAYAGGGTPNSFNICMKFNRPINWGASSTINLIVEMINKSTSSQSHFEDFCSKPAASCTTSRAYAFSATASTAAFVDRNQGLIMWLGNPTAGTYTTFGTSCYTAPGPCTVLPKAFTNTMGNSSNTYPQANANMRYQQVFLGSEIGPSQTWSELDLRRDEAFGGPAESQRMTVIIGDTTLNYANLGTNFDKNFRNKLSPVFDGTLNLPAYTGGGTPNSFDIAFKFNRPISWGATSTINLLVEMINKSASSKPHYEDACNTPIASCTTSRVYAFSATATVATTTRRNEGLIMCLRQPGSTGMVIGNSGVPTYGSSFNVTLSKAPFPNKPAVLWLGNRVNISLAPTFPGCTLYATPLLYPLAVTATNASGSALANIGIPNNVVFKNIQFANQWLVLDTTLSPPLVLSNGGEGFIGGH